MVARGIARCLAAATAVAVLSGPAAAMIDDVAFGRLSVEDAIPAPGPDLAVLREAIELYRRGDVAGGDRVRAGITDPAAIALTEWLAIRSGAAMSFERIAAFLRAENRWPAGPVVRRRAEEALLANRKPAHVVRAFFATTRPVTASGKLALALAFQAEGLEEDAAALVRDAWRRDNFGAELEGRILANFPDALSRADHRFRMERNLLKGNTATARRAAARAGKEYATLIAARGMVGGRGKRAQKVFDAVPASLRADSSWLFTRAQHLRRTGKAAEAAKLVIGAPRDAELIGDGDEWWTERRLVARALLDAGDAKTAYEVVKGHTAETAARRIEAEFHAGWIALRFLEDPAAAGAHFETAAKIAGTPISVARAAYWQGRAAEAAGAGDDANAHYKRAAAHPITYYGQLAKTKLGHDKLVLRDAPEGLDEGRVALERLHAAKALRLLYAMGARDLALPLYGELANRLDDGAKLAALGDVAAEQRDARGLLVVGKAAVQRGFPLDTHAYPTLGIPAFEPVGDAVEKAMVYAIARQESMFDPRARSHAGARGLMQLMPATAQRTAKRYGVKFNLDRLIEDPPYNAKIGAAHLGELMQDWRGSVVLVFASYNAGGGNVKKWIDAYGDPRRPDVDVIDWIERIPFSETRNYVQRVLENLQVYRHRLGSERSALLTEKDLARSLVR